MIRPRSHRKAPREYEEHLHKERNRVERLLTRVKHDRRVATHYEETGRKFLAFWRFAPIMVLSL